MGSPEVFSEPHNLIPEQCFRGGDFKVCARRRECSLCMAVASLKHSSRARPRIIELQHYSSRGAEVRKSPAACRGAGPAWSTRPTAAAAETEPGEGFCREDSSFCFGAYGHMYRGPSSEETSETQPFTACVGRGLFLHPKFQSGNQSQ